MTQQRIIVGITGASGAIYGIELLKALSSMQVESHLVISKAAHLTIKEETSQSLEDIHALADVVHIPNDIAATISSGSFKTDGMIVAPCSMRSLAEIATGNTTSLLSRAADVVLKERRKLVLMVRETPLHAIHIQNMLSVTQAGGIIAPPVPAFYNNPKNIDDLVRHSVGRVLDLFDLDHELVSRWKGLKK